MRTTLISGCVSKLTSGDFGRISTLSSSFVTSGVVLCVARDDGIGNFGWNPFSGRVFCRDGQRLLMKPLFSRDYNAKEPANLI